MKLSTVIIAGVVAIPLLFIGAGFVLPSSSHIERSIEIDADAGRVFFLVGDHLEFQSWSPWAEFDPDMTVEFAGPAYGIGSTMSWSGNEKVGKGSSRFVEHTPNKRAVTMLDFGDMGDGRATYELEELNGKTRITWSYDTQHNNIAGRYLGVMLDRILGPSYEKGLQNLKARAEALPSIKTENVMYSAGDLVLNGYLAYPIGLLDPVPGVLIVHEWWGHNDYVRKRADMLAKMGYVAFALDMYGDGKTATHPDDAMRFMQEVGANSELAQARFDAALELLSGHYFADKSNIAAIGYCFGGSVVLNMARLGKDLQGVASFHGGLGGLVPIPQGQEIPPALVLNGANDPLVLEEHKENFKQEMNAHNAEFEFIDYADAMHGFTNPAATDAGQKFELPLAYNEVADEASWAELEEFLKTIFYKKY